MNTKFKKETPPLRTLGSSKSSSFIRPKYTPAQGGRALPVPKRPDLDDSSPTPVLELGFRELSSRFLLIASRLESHAIVVSKNVLKLDFEKAKRCTELAKEAKDIAKRIENWPKLSLAALSGERNYCVTRYLDIVAEAQSLTEGRVP